MSKLYKDTLAKWKANPTGTVYIGSTDTAKMIRAQLKAKFPNTKFSVRTDKYSGGSSIRIRWTDGPTQDLVDAVVKSFAGSGFDGMTDYKYSVGAWLMPDGTASTRKIEAHYGTDGEVIEAAIDGAIPVSFCADFVFTDRDYSTEALKRTAQAYARKWADPLAEAIKRDALQIEDSYFGARFVNADSYTSETGEHGSTALWRMAQRRMLPVAA
jgi:hypothetical protein